MPLFLNFYERSIKRLVMSSFVFVLMLPMGFFVYSAIGNSWDNVKEDILEKHKLIATSMVEPFNAFITSKQQSLQVTGEDIYELLQEENKHKSHAAHVGIQKQLDRYLRSYDDLIAISYEAAPGFEGHQHTASRKLAFSQITKPNYKKIPLTSLHTFEGDELAADLMSSVFKSTISESPVILIKHYILNDQGVKVGALYAEFSLDYIGNICSKISFGIKGHCAIVDESGHVLAHPNKGWVKNIRDISKISVVKKMMRGESGTTTFYSPFMKADMVAGYTSVPVSGWGVMVPQPKSELTTVMDKARDNTIAWLSAGLLVALVIAYLLTNKITAPISDLVKRTNEIDSGYEYINLGRLPKNSPTEIKKLWTSISILLIGLQKSNKEVKKLNVSLNREVYNATKELQATNRHLFEISSKDYLTNIANRRFFTSKIAEVIQSKKTDQSIGVVMIDVDKFKFINDEYGHEAGDQALIHIARILVKMTRDCDLAARLGGDEFVLYIKNNTDNSMSLIAEQLRTTVEQNPLRFEDKLIKLTLSIGTVNYKSDEKISLEKLLGFADEAMYVSKEAGRNHVAAYSFEETDNQAKIDAA